MHLRHEMLSQNLVAALVAEVQLGKAQDQSPASSVEEEYQAVASQEEDSVSPEVEAQRLASRYILPSL